MLKTNLSHIPQISLLRSDKILYDLIESLKNKKKNKSNSLTNTLRDFYPNSYRLNDIDNSVKSVMKDENFSLNYNFEFLNELFDKFFKFNGSYIYAKEESVEIYSSIINKVHPYFIIGYKLADSLNRGTININEIELFSKYISHLAFKRDSFDKDYAENHLHFNGAIETPLNLLYMFEQKETNKGYYDKGFLNQLPRLSEFDYINSNILNFGGLIDIAKSVLSTINKFVIDGYLKKEININQVSNKIRYEFYSFEFLSTKLLIKNDTMSKLMNLVLYYYKSNDKNREFFIYTILIFYIFLQNKNQILNKYIKVYIHIFNIIRSYMVMSQNIGLTHFSEFFRSKFSKVVKDRYKNISENLILNGTTKIEAKISPSAIFDNEFLIIKDSLDSAIKVERELNPNLEKYPSYLNFLKDKERVKEYLDNFFDKEFDKIEYQFSIHFIRKNENRKKSLNNLLEARFIQVRKEIKKEAFQLDKFLNSCENKEKNYYDFYDKNILTEKYRDILKVEKFNFTNLITSIDIAGDETRTPPEVFAPIVRFLRREPKNILKSNLTKECKHHKKLRLSVHAGEDFNHIITGMRRVDETINFYEMEAKDRLGHALAIGINPLKWAKRSGEIFMTKEEFLDNLVWLRSKMSKLNLFYSKATSFIDYFDNKIYKYSKELYSKNYNFNQLFEAYNLRKYCPIEFLSNKMNKSSFKFDDYIRNAIPNEKISEEIKEIYITYDRCAKYWRESQKIITLGYSKSKNQIYDEIITSEELEMYEALQDMLMSEYNNMGIIIEANPSSNIYIANLHSYKEHPIFRWNPPKDEMLQNGGEFNKFGIRDKNIKVCINSDDPAIFPTTLQNEFKVLKNSVMCDYNCCENLAEEWVEKLRIFGVEVFNSNKLKV